MQSKVNKSGLKIDELINYIQLGKNEIPKVKGKDLIIFLGNTGSGKSTLINYINGCTMEETESDLGEMVIQVKKNSQIQELTKIGHTKESETFIPDIKIGNDGTIYVDMPGFFDNRGQEISIANSVNIKNILVNAKTVKIIVLISYHSLMNNRKNGEKELINLLLGLFGGDEKIPQNKDSLIILISHLTNSNGSYKRLEPLKKITFSCLEDRVTTADPLDNPLPGGLKKMELIEFIKKMKPIENCKDLFNTVLTADNKNCLVECGREISKKLEKSMKCDEIKQTQTHLECLCQLSIIEHNEINQIIEESKKQVASNIINSISEFQKLCSEEQFTIADVKLNILLEMLDSFKMFDDLTSLINKTNLKSYYNTAMNKKNERENFKNEMENKINKISEVNAKLAGNLEKMLEEIKVQKKKNEDLDLQNEDQKKKIKNKIQKEKDELDKKLGCPAGVQINCSRCNTKYMVVDGNDFYQSGTIDVYRGYCEKCTFNGSRSDWNYSGNAVRVCCKKCDYMYYVVNWGVWKSATYVHEKTGCCQWCYDERND